MRIALFKGSIMIGVVLTLRWKQSLLPEHYASSKIGGQKKFTHTQKHKKLLEAHYAPQHTISVSWYPAVVAFSCTFNTFILVFK